MQSILKLKDDEFNYLVNMVKNKYGINLTHKRVLLEGRLSNSLTKRGYTNYMSYIRDMETDKSGKEITNFLNKVTTNHTYFMREADHFRVFRDQVLPYWERRINNNDLRVWCAASSSGEEPYTLAMIMQDYFSHKPQKWDKTLLATDISLKVLDEAQQGIYSTESIAKIPPLWKSKYFTKLDDEHVKVNDQIKKEVIFKQFNLMNKIVAPKPYHVIFCRNVMIYFDAQTKADLVERMYDVLAPGGFLFTGQAESVARPTRFNSVMPSVYQKGEG